MPRIITLGRHSSRGGPVPYPITCEQTRLGTFYPAGYGAKGDGLTDDTVAIQAALTAAAVAGGVVSLPQPGTYILTAQGSNPYQAGHRYCLDIAGNNVTLLLG